MKGQPTPFGMWAPRARLGVTGARHRALRSGGPRGIRTAGTSLRSWGTARRPRDPLTTRRTRHIAHGTSHTAQRTRHSAHGTAHTAQRIRHSVHAAGGVTTTDFNGTMKPTRAPPSGRFPAN